MISPDDSSSTFRSRGMPWCWCLVAFFLAMVASRADVLEVSPAAKTLSAGVHVDDVHVRALGLGFAEGDQQLTTQPMVIDSFYPMQAVAGLKVSVRGSGFINVASVEVAGVACTQFRVVSPEQLELIVPQGLRGDGKIVVRGTDGEASSAQNILVPALKATVVPSYSVAAYSLYTTPRFSVLTQGSAPFSFQWKENGEAITWATSSAVSLSAPYDGRTNDYSVSVSDQTGATVTSSFQVKYVNVGISPERKIGGPSRFRYVVSIIGPDYGSALSLPSWVSLAKRVSSFVVFEVAENMTDQDRSATISINGFDHQLLQRAKGTAVSELWTVGNNSEGQLGNFKVFEMQSSSVPLHVDTEVARVFAAGDSTYYLKTDGSLWGFGGNQSGQQGNGSTVASGSPHCIDVDVTDVFAGLTALAYRKGDGSLWACGASSSGMLGEEGVVFHPRLVAIDVAAAALGRNYLLYVAANGNLYVQGFHSFRTLADTRIRKTVGQTNVEADLMEVGVGKVAAFGDNALILTKDGRVFGIGPLWAPSAGTEDPRLTPVWLADQVKEVGSGYNALFFIKKDDTLWGVGDSLAVFGKGNGAQASPVLLASNMGAVGSGYAHATALRGDGMLLAFGANADGVFGDAAVAKSIAGFPVAGSVTAVAVGNRHSAWITQGDNRVVTRPPVIDTMIYQASGTAGGLLLRGSGFSRVQEVRIGDRSVTFEVLSLDEILISFSTGNPVEGVVTVVSDQGSVTTEEAVNSSRLVITKQPEDVTIDVGKTLTLSVEASSAYGISYTWYRNDIYLNSGNFNLPTLTIGDITAASAGTYQVRLHSGNVTVASRKVQVRVVDTFFSEKTKEVGAGRVKYYLGVTSGSTWNAVADVPWLSIQQEGDAEEGRVCVVVEPSFETTVREGRITAGLATHVVRQHPRSERWREVFGVGLSANGQLGYVSLAKATSVPSFGQVRTQVREAASGYYHSVIVDTGDVAWTVGDSSGGQLGDPNYDQSFEFVRVMSEVKSVAAGGMHTLFLKKDGTLWGAGSNTRRQLGENAGDIQKTPLKIAEGVVAAAAGTEYSVYITDDGTLWGVGSNLQGQLGHQSLPVFLSPGIIDSDVVSVAAGDYHLLYIKRDGSLWVTGYNEEGQLGLGSKVSRTTPIKVAEQVSKASAGFMHSLFVKMDGSLFGMGLNNYGQLGDGTILSRLTPIKIADGVDALSAGYYHSVYSKANGAVYAMGFNSYGQLGSGTFKHRLSPVLVGTGVPGLKLDAGPFHTLLVNGDATLLSAGNNSFGQAGRGYVSYELEPLQLRGGIRALGAGDKHTWLLDAADSLWGFGSNAHKQLGVTPLEDCPEGVLLGTTLEAAAAGAQHTLLLYKSGELRVLGRLAGMPAYLGAGPFSSPMLLYQDATGVVSGQAHLLFLRNNSLWAQGSNTRGQLGNGTKDAVSGSVFVQTAGVRPVQYAAGGAHSLYVFPDGTLWGMGANDRGQLGDGTRLDRPSPVQLATNVRFVAAGRMHTLLVKEDNSLWVAGANERGQLGDGTIVDRTAFVKIASDVEKVAAGAQHSLMLRKDRRLWAFGSNEYAQLGDGTRTSRTVPVEVAANIVDMAAGYAHSLWLAEGEIRLGAQGPEITAVSRLALSEGMEIEVVGANFNAVKGVYFGQVAASSYTVVSSDRIRVTVPAVALGVGRVSVETEAGKTTFPQDYTATAPVAPSFREQPLDMSVVEGARVVLSAAVDGTPVLRYQWFRNGQPLSGATQAALELAAAQPTDSAGYSVEVGNVAGKVVSRTAALRVAPLGTRVLHRVVGIEEQGAKITVMNLVHAPSALAGIQWRVLLPDGWSLESANLGGLAPVSAPVVGDSGALVWSFPSVTQPPLSFTYTLRVPVSASSPRQLVAAVQLDDGTWKYDFLAKTDPLPVPLQLLHSADVNLDGRIDTTELVAAMRLFETRQQSVRTGAYLLDVSAADGFGPDVSRSQALPAALAWYHSADTDRDGRIGLAELTRLIQLHNTRQAGLRTGVYHPRRAGEAEHADGFTPGP